MFQQNMGSVDRIVRAVLAVVMIPVGFFVLQGALGIIVGVLGVVFGLTALLGFCPLYLPFKFSTRKTAS
jgi:hypothetical protein